MSQSEPNWSSFSWNPDNPRRDPSGLTALEYVVRHVFLPIFYPRVDDYTPENAHALACAVYAAACAYNEYIGHAHEPHWLQITKMLERLQVILTPIQRFGMLYPDQFLSQFGGLKTGDTLVFPAPYLDDTYGVIFRRQDHCTLYELLHPSECPAEERRGIGSYPELAIEIPNEVFDDGKFRSKLAGFLSGRSRKPLTGMLHGVGPPVEPKCITKRYGPGRIVDDLYEGYWSRSHLWFLIRFAIQSSLGRSLGHGTYKAFMLFFMCNLANYAINTGPPSIVLHSMSAKILRRFRKLGPSVPPWLRDAVSHTCTSLSQTLDGRWQEMRSTQSSSAPWDPSQLDLTKDIHSSFPHIHEYITISLASRGSGISHAPFLPNSRLRGTLDDFLSRPECFSMMHHDDTHVTLYDVERSVCEDIDDWVACTTDVDKACKQLGDLVHQYQSIAMDIYCNVDDPDHLSIMLLTIIEIWVVLDKLVVKEIPILADYSPEIPLDFPQRLLLRDALSIHRLCRAYQYLFARHARAHLGWSVLSNTFTERSFPCRYYDSSPHLQCLKARIHDALPSEPLHAKVVVFELQRPVSFDMWRSVTCLISRTGGGEWHRDPKDIQVRNIPALQPYVSVSRRHEFSLYSGLTPHHHWGGLYYVYEGPILRNFEHAYKLPKGPSADSRLQRYLDNTKHTSNEVLAAQANCHPDLSSREFIAFGQLRSGGSLQWLNILRELRSRTLCFRRQEVYLLLAQASSGVGPLDSTGELLWHQEVQDASFCHALLDELERLFIDDGMGSLDGPAMAIISLLAGVLASKSSGDVSEQAIELLQNVRRKTYIWVHELLYDVRRSPTNEESLEFLRDMAAICRSTFDVGSPTSHKLFRSAQDIQAVLSCAMIIRTTILPASSGMSHPSITSNNTIDFKLSDLPAYSRVLLNRDSRLSLVLEASLRDAIQADASDVGVDRAVQLVWPSYRPGLRRWKPLPSPNSRWLICETAQTRDRRLQLVHVNLLDGSLLVDGKPIGNRLPSHVTSNPTYYELFGKRELMVVASDLPGVDFATISAIHKHYVHFAVRENDQALMFWKDKWVIIFAQNEDTGDIFELISRERLQGDLPKSLIEGHLHWLNLSTSIIEIRPIEKPWEQSSDNWSIHLRSGQSSVIKGGDSEFLVDKQSSTWKMVSSRLRCLDDPENLIISVFPVNTTQSPPSQLSVTLPRYSLSFFVNEVGQLESRDFRDMVYDEDQCIGTLFGLVNRLVLRPKACVEVDFIPKCILIPHGDSLDLRGHNVYVKFPSSGPVRHYTYQVDSELGRLKGIVSLESRLYLAHLHALTGGGCRPDPLTGRTGVEEAISLIWLAGTRQQSEHWGSSSESQQIRFAFAKLRNPTERRFVSLREEELLQEAYLFPSEIVASVVLPGKRPLDELLHERPAPNLQARDSFPCYNPGSYDLPAPKIDPLRQLFSSLRTNETAPAFQSQYVSRLHSSAHYFQTTHRLGAAYRPRDSGKLGPETLRKHYAQCRINYTESLDMVKLALGPKTQFERIIDQGGQWPRVMPFILFRCLASTSTIQLSESWKKCLINLALLALDLQRARRLLQFALDNLEEDLHRELGNEGCDGWDAAEHPDWLLIQLQGNFLIRRVQADVAKEMMSPRSGKNTVMQVNMGEGKTSVIIPICAAALADGDQLVRVIVPKALIPHTMQLLTDRLCGLVNKPIYHLTFSRNDIDHKEVGKVDHLHKLVSECRGECGIIVTQPEDVLSLKLACVEMQLRDETRTNLTSVVQRCNFEHVLHVHAGSLVKSLDKNAHVFAVIEREKRWHCKPGIPQKSRAEKAEVIKPKPPVARILLELQWFLETHARDILDECDDVLRPQFQLIYAIGHQHSFEGSPGRWIIIQQVLELVKRHANLLATPDSYMIRCDSNPPGSFPHIHILAEGGEQLMSLIAQDVLDGRIHSLRFHSELGLREAIRNFVLRKDIHPDTVKIVEKYAHQSASWGSLLLLRGLLAHNILLFAFTQRRWRVDYGLDRSSPPRTMLAIPYRAKDVPAETAEFGHPDITILLTCLSYYYGGLSEAQLRASFELLLQQDDPSSEYALWLEDCGATSVPNPLRKLSGVNIRSFEQWVTHLVPLFARNKRAIDMYLSKIVFPKHAKEFPQRISGSYWDIAERKNHLVTGFSGTNDGQYLLPTSIVQDDQDHLQQMGTNAMVLAYLLQPENSSYMVTTDGNGERWTTTKLLRMVVAQNPPIRVLLDVGAQILDLPNLELAKAWLDLTPAAEIAGAIYFNEYNNLIVLTRNGTTHPLSSSPLVQQLHRCVTYLDHAHTRGTDLNFPRGFRAAVTLGHKVTKDRLVQGCMRMRKLGHGHSVMFFTPHEVDQRIRTLVGKENQSIAVTTGDILHWAIHETWSDIQRQAPYWAQQGINHQSRYGAWSRLCQTKATSDELADAWVQPELKSLTDMYMPCHSPGTTTSANLPRQIRDCCANFGVLSLPDVRMDEEQEREISREIDRELEVVERPPRASPATHSLHPDVIAFVRTGDIPLPSLGGAFRHVFATSLTAASSGLHAWSSDILATADFCETIRESHSVQDRMNDYLRPVQWVLSGKMSGRDTLVLLSPYEVNLLMPEIRISEHVHLHLYIPRTTKRMQPSDDLKLYSVPPVPSDWIPPWALIDQLNVFAGQLYLSDYASYVRVCRFLGVHTEDVPQESRTVVARNWFSNPDLSDAEIKERFEGMTLPLVILLLAVRLGLGFAETHIGRILEGWRLSEVDFQRPPDLVKSIAIGHDFGQEQLSEQESMTTRKRVSHSKPSGRQLKRKRPN